MAALASAISELVNTFDDRCIETTCHFPSIFAEVEVQFELRRERPPGHRKEFVLHRPVGDRNLAIAEEVCRRSEFGGGQITVEGAPLTPEHAIIIRLDLGVPARHLAVEPGDRRLRMHLRQHAVDILGIDAGFDLAEQLDQRLAIGRVRIGFGSHRPVRTDQDEKQRKEQIHYRTHAISSHCHGVRKTAPPGLVDGH
jgi:hypothetical protein